ncbi:MAG: PEGA domain-containing protein, partial [Salinivirgaceae bacterium]|nr:PEGA domain-containing protein [Salinivirgaceae bacterium]
MTSTKYLIPKKIGSVIIFVLVIVQGFSQKLIVSNFKEQPTDISAREFEVLDVNDEPCALLKVYTGFKNIKVDGNRGIEKLEEKNGEVWIWVSHGTRQLKFSKEGFPLLPFYFENELEKSTVYALGLSSDEMHSIVIHTGTETADVFIANKKYTSNVTIPGFSEGNYPVKIVKLGYKTIFDTLRVTKDNLYFSYSLEPIQQQKLKIKSIPTGAFLIINGQPVGNTDFTGFYYPGEYRIQLSKKDYLPIDTLIVFESSKSSEVLLTMEKNFAWLRFYAKPTTARIMLDGNLVTNLSQHR